MWYFTWFIGITMAILLATMHTLWYEVQVDEQIIKDYEEKSRASDLPKEASTKT